MFYSVKEMEKIRKKAADYGLDADPCFWVDSADLLRSVCNGCGAERWSDLKRKIFTLALKRYEPAFAVHDYDYDAITDCSQEKGDKRLKSNMIKIWKKDFGFFRWFTTAGRTERLVIIPAVFAAVSLAGKKAYKMGKENGGKK